jgi:hypothetical protein
MHDRLHLLATILAQWWRPVASSEALDLLYCYWAMQAILYQRTTTAINMTRKVGAFFCCHFISCHPGSRRGDTEQVVA